MRSKVATIVSWVLAVMLAMMYGMAGIGKFGDGGQEMFANWGYPGWFATAIGGLEVLGAIGLLIPKTTRWAALGLIGVMLGAAYTHVANGEGAAILRPLGFIVALAFVWWLRRPADGA